MQPRVDTAERLRAAGLRATRPRALVLETLAAVGGHRTADDVVRLLRECGTPLPRATVYNVLDDLSRVQLVMRADAGPGVSRFEAAEDWHHHFVCRRCGIIVDVPCAVGEKPCLEPDIEGADVDEAQVIFRGLCPTCADVDR